MTENFFMMQAIIEAKKALAIDEAPIGAIIVKDGIIIARGFNKRESLQKATAHAEIIAIEKACKKLKSFRLNDCDLYVTLEPCCMCAGACINSRIRKIYFGAYDSRFGCVGSIYNLPTDERFNHRCAVEGGINEDECAKMLSDYFKEKRTKNKL